MEGREKHKTFTAEDLVVTAWQRFPDSFGLAGYSGQYPDSNRVLTNIMGTKGMRGKGWLQKVGEKQYRLTGKALADAGALSERSTTQNLSSALGAELDRTSASSLQRLLSPPAAKKALAGEIEAVTFNDACGFWDITARTNANTLKAKLSERLALLSRALKASGAPNGEGLQLSADRISHDEIKTLLDIDEFMQQKFKAELDVIRRRSDERLEPRRRRHRQHGAKPRHHSRRPLSVVYDPPVDLLPELVALSLCRY